MNRSNKMNKEFCARERSRLRRAANKGNAEARTLLLRLLAPKYWDRALQRWGDPETSLDEMGGVVCH